MCDYIRVCLLTRKQNVTISRYAKFDVMKQRQIEGKIISM